MVTNQLPENAKIFDEMGIFCSFLPKLTRKNS